MWKVWHRQSGWDMKWIPTFGTDQHAPEVTCCDKFTTHLYPTCRVLSKKLTFSCSTNSLLLWNQRFTTVTTEAHQWILSWANSIHFTSSQCISANIRKHILLATFIILSLFLVFFHNLLPTSWHTFQLILIYSHHPSLLFTFLLHIIMSV